MNYKIWIKTNHLNNFKFLIIINKKLWIKIFKINKLFSLENIGLFAILSIFVLFPELAMAGQDSLSSTMDDKMVDTIKKGGKIIALCSFGIGLVASIVKMNAMAFISSIGVSLAALYGPAIITGLFSGTI